MPRTRRLPVALAALALALVLVLVAAACGSDGGDGDDGDDAGSTVTTAPSASARTDQTTEATRQDTGVEGEITVFAAASLTEAFSEVVQAFTAANPGAEAILSLDASSALVQQITQGAPADVFASADTANMDKLVAAELNDGDPVVFATNRLAIIVAPGNPLGITGVADLADPDLTTVICAPEVPCGRYADDIFTRAGVAASVDSFEQNVRGVVTKVTAGEADAGIVYATDITAAGEAADGVDIPADLDVVAEYPIALVDGSDDAEASEAFIGFLTGPDGQAILSRYGFGPPTAG